MTDWVLWEFKWILKIPVGPGHIITAGSLIVVELEGPMSGLGASTPGGPSVL
jgi:hypothetical protein